MICSMDFNGSHRASTQDVLESVFELLKRDQEIGAQLARKLLQLAVYAVLSTI
jgi:hypothetical protein